MKRLPDERPDALNRVLSTGFPLELLSRITETSDITMTELLDSITNLLEGGMTAETLIADYSEKFPDIVNSYLSYERSQPGCYIAKRASQFGDRRTVFIWYPYIVRKEVNICMASGGSGKTYASCLIASYVSRGEALPGDYKPPKPENVLIISGEDTGELLKERLTACKADLDKVFILDCHDSTGLNFGSDAETFKTIIAAYKPALTIIDPLQSFIGEQADLNKVNCIRPIMQRLATIAKEVDTAVLLIMHVNKRPQTNNLNDSASGSTDFVNASRSALYILFDEENDDSRLIIHSKCNYTPFGKTIRFTFNDTGGVFWNGFSEIDRFTVEEANRKRKSPGELLKAHAEAEETNETLIRALMDAADPTNMRRFSYDSFKEKYGSFIFGSQQPKRALDSITDAMLASGYQIESGKRVKDGEITRNGFFIIPVSEDQNADQISMVHDL